MTDYPKPALTVDAVVLAGLGEHMEILLIRRAKDPYQGALALPGGFVDPYEQPRAAVLRELAEETGLVLSGATSLWLSPRGVKGRDPRGWTVSLPMLFHIDQPLPIKAGDDAAEAHWVALSELDRLAFDHGAIVCEALGRFWPEMPTADPRVSHLTVYGRGALGTDLTFFGGSFNPWHQGHEACLAASPNRAGLVVVPDNNPFKDGVVDGCCWALYRQIVARAEHFGAVVFPGFCGQEAANPTITWFPYVNAARKGLLIGDDSFADLPRWIEADALAKHLHHLHVVPRDADPGRVENAQDWCRRHAPGCEVHMLEDHPHRHVSSTKIRQADAS